MTLAVSSRRRRNRHYSIKELVAHAPAPFLEAVWPVFVEGLRRERLELSTGRLSYPSGPLAGGEAASRSTCGAQTFARDPLQGSNPSCGLAKRLIACWKHRILSRCA